MPQSGIFIAVSGLFLADLLLGRPMDIHRSLRHAHRTYYCYAARHASVANQDEAQEEMECNCSVRSPNLVSEFDFVLLIFICVASVFVLMWCAIH